MPQAETLTLRMLVGYGVSSMPAIYGYMLVLIMYMKYAATELGASTAAVGTVFLFAKIWDAVTDPLVGSASDRTRSASGRRRPWLLASAPLLALFSVMVWVPPASLEGGALIAWIAFSVFGFYTAFTIFEVPHMALGAELSLESSARNRIFGIRQSIRIVAMFAAGVLGTWAVGRGVEAARIMAWVVAGLTLVMVFYGVAQLPPERAEFRGRGGTNPFRALADVLRNRHARLLLAVIFIDALGTGGIGVLAPFVLDYVVGSPQLVPALIGANMISTLAAVPLWIRLAHRFEKRRLMLVSMIGSGLGYGSIVLVGPGDWLLTLGSGVVAGASSACPNILGYTLKSEIIDWDEYVTGERKEGAYFAGWSFVGKLAGGLMIGLVGWALAWVGFDGEAETQTELVQTTMVLLMGGFPLVCYGLGAIAFSRFGLDEQEHARIRSVLDARAVAARAEARHEGASRAQAGHEETGQAPDGAGATTG